MKTRKRKIAPNNTMIPKLHLISYFLSPCGGGVGRNLGMFYFLFWLSCYHVLHHGDYVHIDFTKASKSFPACCPFIHFLEFCLHRAWKTLSNNLFSSSLSRYDEMMGVDLCVALSKKRILMNEEKRLLLCPNPDQMPASISQCKRWVISESLKCLGS